MKQAARAAIPNFIYMDSPLRFFHRFHPFRLGKRTHYNNIIIANLSLFHKGYFVFLFLLIFFFYPITI